MSKNQTKSTTTEVAPTKQQSSPKPRKKAPPKIPYKKDWTAEDSKLLLELAKRYKNDWKKVAKKFTEATKTRKAPSFFKNRFREINNLPHRKKIPFTHKEDLNIVNGIDCFGFKWEKIASYFPQRNATMIKNRYYSYLRFENRYEDLL